MYFHDTVSTFTNGIKKWSGPFMTATSQLRVPVQVPVENRSKRQKHLGFCANLGFHAVRVVTSQRFVHMRASWVRQAILAYFLLKYHEKSADLLFTN